MSIIKNKFKRGLALALAVLLLLPLFCVSLSASEYDLTQREPLDEGIRFYSSSYCKTQKALPSRPITVEAEVQLNTTGRGGVILGNYRSDGYDCISFEIHNNGNPRVFVSNKQNQRMDIIFTSVTICSSSFVRLAITIDEANGKAHCYLNGELKQSLDFSYDVLGDSIACETLCIGGDLRGGNNVAFQGQIKSVAVYSDMRTSDEIKNYFDLEDESLLIAYDLVNTGAKNLSSLEGYDLDTNKVQIIASTDNAISFSSNNTYKVVKPFESQIFTYEAWIKIPTTMSSSTRIGTLFGNYKSSTPSVNLEFKDGATPRLYFEKAGGTLYDFHFTGVDARSDDWTFVAITLDSQTGEARCYINGELRQTITKGELAISDSTYDSEFWLGRDSRGASGYIFQGGVKGLAVYDDVRTADEIKADMSAFDASSDGLIAMYEFSGETGRADITGNGYHVSYDGENLPNEGGDTDPDTPSVPSEIGGLEFGGSDYATVIKDFDTSADAYTFEATIQLPISYGDRGGVILGNFKDNNNHYFNFEIYSGGVPRISGTYASNLSTRYDYRFSQVDVRSDKPVHLAITLDKTTGEAKCYLNGVLKQTVTQGAPIEMAKTLTNNRMVLGNDLRNDTKQNFKGIISSVAVFTDIRSASEISADVQTLPVDSDGLMLCYDLTEATHGEDIADLSGNGYTVKFTDKAFAEKGVWLTEKEPVTDYLYSFAVVGDTQIIARNHPSQFTKIYDWILSNKDSKKIGYVFGLGDITDGNSSSEWSLATTHILNRLTGIIPYSVVRGNHDGRTQFNGVFAVDSYMNQFDGFYAENDVTNSYRFFEIEGTKYLLFTLDYGASDSVLEWAGSIIEQSPNRKVIITTHAYLYRDGTTLDAGDVCPPSTSGGSNNGDHMWDKLISKYENIYLVMSGHDPCADVVVTQTNGANGNIVTQILSDHQGVDTSTPTGMVTMLYFKADGSIEVETYSTIQEKFYKETNQFVIEETEHSFEERTAIAYENGFDKGGKITYKCSKCDFESKKDCAPLISAKGYSLNSERTAINGGYSVNLDLFALYKDLNGAIKYGIVIASADAFDGKSFFNESNMVNTDKAIQVEMDAVYQNFDCSIEFGTTQNGTLNLVICAYVIDNGTVSFIQADSEASSAVDSGKIAGGAFSSVTLDSVSALHAEKRDEE